MAASNVNVVVITGNLTRDPELRSTGGGTSVCELRVAVNSRRKDGQTGEWVDKPNYFDVTVWGAQGENCANYLAKGRPVAVEGRLDWREWEAKDGSGKRQASRSSPTRSSSSARATAPALAAATATVASPRAATFRPTPPTSRAPRPAPAAAAAPKTTSPSSQLRRRRHASPGQSVASRAEWPEQERVLRDEHQRGAPRRRPRPPAQVHADQRRGRRLQGPQPAAPLPLRQGEDARPPRHRAFPPPPAPALGGGEAGARDRPAALRRRALMAQAILLQDVEALGERGQAIDVAPGYLRNYLIPRKLAQPATAGALEEAQRRREAAEKAEKARAEREAQAAGLLSKTVLTIHQRAGEDGKLFGSVGAEGDRRRAPRGPRPAHRPPQSPPRAAAARSRHLHGRDRARRRHRRLGQDDHHRGEVSRSSCAGAWEALREVRSRHLRGTTSVG